MDLGLQTFIIAGLLIFIAMLISGAGIYVLVNQKLQLAGNKVHVMMLDIPFLGKIQSAYPSVVAIFLGVGLGSYVWSKWDIQHEQMQLHANLRVDHAGPRQSAPIFLAV